MHVPFAMPVRATCQRRNRADTDLERVALAWVQRNRAAMLGEAPGGASVAGSPAIDLDPTRGATRAHPHNETPDWARYRLPVALIGRYLFYAE